MTRRNHETGNEYYRIHRENDGSVAIELGTMSTQPIADAILDSREGKSRDLLVQIRKDHTAETVAYTSPLLRVRWPVYSGEYHDAHVVLQWDAERVRAFGAAGRVIERWVAAADKAHDRREQRGAAVSYGTVGPESWIEALQRAKVREVVLIEADDRWTDHKVIAREVTNPDSLVRVPAASAAAAE